MANQRTSTTKVDAPDAREGRDVESIKKSFVNHLRYTFAKTVETATPRDQYQALVHTVRDHLVGNWVDTQRHYHAENPKRVYYLSLEFLIGRTLGNSLINLKLFEECRQALQELGIHIEQLREQEWDAGLGNGGLGRLAACFLDSMATLGLPGYGYGIRYDYGIFYQRIKDGYQVETPDAWLRYGNPWEIARPEYLYPVQFHGRVVARQDAGGGISYRWEDTQTVMALAYDTPVPGYANDVVNTLRLWSAKSSRGFELNYFNHGDYIRAVEDKNRTENISRVLYPNDNMFEGKELRLKQEYFLVSATLQDIVRRFKESNTDIQAFPDKVAMQLNDTHPALGIAELMRIFVDDENLTWENAWDLTVRTCSYTNHTLLTEALERWPISLMEHVLPRHLQIIFEINHRFLEKLKVSHPDRPDLLSRLSIIQEDGERAVRMGNLAVIGSHKVNGVSALHTRLVKEDLFRDFNELWPGKIVNMTNGITPRRWLKKANWELADLISDHIGDGWVRHLEELRQLVPLADDAKFRAQWAEVKLNNKKQFSNYLAATQGIELTTESLFSTQVKRIHEYKRQLLNILYVIAQYNRIKDNPSRNQLAVPRSVMIGGKAAPGYYMAKLIIKLITAVADKVNGDTDVAEQLRVAFLENYRVSLAEKVIPATELSEQISTAGMEASGTGNMKFALNGALTIGTLDGANVEIREEVGEDNIFIFGMNADEVQHLKHNGYDPRRFYQSNPELKRVIDMVHDGYFSPEDPDLFKPITDGLLQGGDHYCVLADFDSYFTAQEAVNQAYLDQDVWQKRSILNVAYMGKFSSDRSIEDYARVIWDAKPV